MECTSAEYAREEHEVLFAFECDDTDSESKYCSEDIICHQHDEAYFEDATTVKNFLQVISGIYELSSDTNDDHLVYRSKKTVHVVNTHYSASPKVSHVLLQSVATGNDFYWWVFSKPDEVTYMHIMLNASTIHRSQTVDAIVLNPFGSMCASTQPIPTVVTTLQLSGIPHGCASCAPGNFMVFDSWNSLQTQTPCRSCAHPCDFPQLQITNTSCSPSMPPTCSACVQGKYLPNLNSTLCAACAAGKYRNASTPVHACQHLPTEDCDDTTPPCAECAPGSFAEEASAACTLCAIDTYANTSAASACTLCAEYEYTKQLGSTACSVCVYLDAGSAPPGELDMRASAPVPLVPRAQPAARVRAAASPDGRCWALVFEDVDTLTGARTASVHVLGPALAASSQALPHGAGDVQVAVSNAALYVALANGTVLRAPVSYDCVPGDLSTANLTQQPGHEFVLFAGTQDAFVLHADHIVHAVESEQAYAWPLAHRRLPWRVQTFVAADGGDALGVIVRDGVAYTRVGDGLCTGSSVQESEHASTRPECEDACSQLAACQAYAHSSAGCRLYTGPIDAAAADPGSDWSCFRANATTRRVMLHRNATHARFERTAEDRLAHELDDWYRGLALTPRNLSHALVYLGGVYLGGAYPRVLRVDTAGAAQVFLLRGCFEPEVRELRAWAHLLPYTHTRLTLGGYVQFCTPGAFFNATHCVQCPIDTFSDSHYATACTPCPARAPHAHAGSSAATDCFRARGPRAHDAYVDRELQALENEYDTQRGVRAWAYPLIPHSALQALDGAGPRDLRALAGEHIEVP